MYKLLIFIEAMERVIINSLTGLIPILIVGLILLINRGRIKRVIDTLDHYFFGS